MPYTMDHKCRSLQVKAIGAYGANPQGSASYLQDQAEPAAVRQGISGRARSSSSSASSQRVAVIFVSNARACIHEELGAAEHRAEWFEASATKDSVLGRR